MKRLLVVLFIGLIFLGSILSNCELDICNLMNCAKKYIPTFSRELDDINLDGVANGQIYHVFTNISNFNYINKKYFNDLIGETFIFDKGFDIHYILEELNFKQITDYALEDKIVIEGYSPKLNKFILKNGIKLNLQISFGHEIKVGYPCILEGF